MLYYTKGMLNAEKGAVFYKGSLKGLKQSEWQRWRVVNISQLKGSSYVVERVRSECYFGLPVWLGGNGFFHSRLSWDEESPFGYDVYSSKAEGDERAKYLIEQTLRWETGDKHKPTVTREVVSWYPDEEEN